MYCIRQSLKAIYIICQIISNLGCIVVDSTYYDYVVMVVGRCCCRENSISYYKT
jgi:hypothetical protein